MTNDPDKGESLSAKRAVSIRSRWGRASVGQPTLAVRLPPCVPISVAQSEQSPAPVATKKQKRTAEEKEVRIAQITAEATDAYNRILAKPHGCLPKATPPGEAERRKNITRCLMQAAAICKDQFGDPRITPEFWERYFNEVNKDDWKAGRARERYGSGHSSWQPTFEFLTRPKTMLEVFEKAVSDE